MGRKSSPGIRPVNKRQQGTKFNNDTLGPTVGCRRVEWYVRETIRLKGSWDPLDFKNGALVEGLRDERSFCR
jgi:hypothetical protein